MKSIALKCSLMLVIAVNIVLLIMVASCSKNDTEPQNFSKYKEYIYALNYGYFKDNGLGRYDYNVDFYLMSDRAEKLDGCSSCDGQIVAIEFYCKGTKLQNGSYTIDGSNNVNVAFVSVEIAKGGNIEDIYLENGTVELSGTKPNYSIKISGMTTRGEIFTSQFSGSCKQL